MVFNRLATFATSAIGGISFSEEKSIDIPK